MKHKILYLFLGIVLLGASAYAQNIQLYDESFEGGPGVFNLNTVGVGANTGTNEWIVNNVYTGGGIYPNTMSEDSTFGGIISYAPFGHYLHIFDLPSTHTDCLYNPANLSDRFAAMSTGFCTMSIDSVLLNFFYLCKGSPTAYGTVYYSRNGGPWIQCGAPMYNNKYKWQYVSIYNPNFGNANDLRFGFRWQNDAGAGKDTSAFAIDDVQSIGIIDTTKHPVHITCIPSPDTICAGGGQSINLTINLSDTLCDGNYSITLSDGNGNFNNSPQGWSTQLYYPTTSITFSLGILASDPAGNCYRFRVNRLTPPIINGIASKCIVIKNCPDTITTMQPLVTSDPNNPVCAGSVIQVPFTSEGTYNAINTYIAELSDSAGNFTPGYPGDSIAFLPSNSAYPNPLMPGVASGLIPFNIPASCHYRIRIVSDTPKVYGKPYGPFCIQHCDIVTNNQQSVHACVKSCYLDPKGFNDSIGVMISKYDTNEEYHPGNKFEVQILSTQTFAVLNTGTFGKKSDSVNCNMPLHIPCGDSLCNMGLPPPPTGTYYMRVVATSSNQADSMLGTLVFLSIGYPQDSLRIQSQQGTTSFCMGGVPVFQATGFSNPLFCTEAYIYSDWSWWVNKTNAVLNNPDYFSVGFPMPSGLMPTAGKYNIIVQEQNNGCYGPRDTMKIQINEIPPIFISGPSPLCQFDTATYSVAFNNNTAYRWSATKYAKNVDTANNILKLRFDSVGRYTIKVFAIDSCGSDSSIKVITVIAAPRTRITGDTVVCQGVPVTLNATAVGATKGFTWSTGETTTSITVNPPRDTLYWVSTGNAKCPSPRDTVRIKILPPAVGLAGNDTTILKGEIANIFVRPTVAGQTYVWSPNIGISCDTCPSTTASPTVTTTYTVIVTSSGGCTRTDTVTVSIKEETIVIPNIFTPNNDGKNDFFVIQNLNYFPGSTLDIFNRWGEKVFSSNNYQNNWDGGGQSDGIYYYVLALPNGKKYQGYVELLK